MSVFHAACTIPAVQCFLMTLSGGREARLATNGPINRSITRSRTCGATAYSSNSDTFGGPNRCSSMNMPPSVKPRLTVNHGRVSTKRHRKTVNHSISFKNRCYQCGRVAVWLVRLFALRSPNWPCRTTAVLSPVLCRQTGVPVAVDFGKARYCQQKTDGSAISGSGKKSTQLPEEMPASRLETLLSVSDRHFWQGLQHSGLARTSLRCRSRSAKKSVTATSMSISRSLPVTAISLILSNRSNERTFGPQHNA